MNHANQVVYAIENKSKTIIVGLIIFCALMAATYVGLVYKTVMNAVAKEKIELQIASINSELSEKEFQYISAKGEVTMELASSLGFVPATQKTQFVTLAKPASSVAVR